MPVDNLTPVQAFLQKHAPTGGALPPHLQEELKLLIAEEKGAMAPEDSLKEVQAALTALGLPVRTGP